MKTILLAATLTVAALCAIPCQAATPLLGNDINGVLYDVSTSTGAATNPRSTGASGLSGISFSPAGTLYGLTTFAGTPANSLVSINPVTGASVTVGATGLSNIFEGDLDFDPTSGVLYGIQNFNSGSLTLSLFTISTSTGAAAVVGTIPAGPADLSALTFSAGGTLYVLDTNGLKLLTVNKSTAAIVSSVSITGVAGLGDTAGMDFDPATGTLYLADGTNNGTNKLYTLNPTSGALTLVGPTGLASGLAGLQFFTPEPSSFLLLAMASAVLAVAQRRRG